MFRYLKAVVQLTRPLPTLSILVISLTGTLIAGQGKFDWPEILVSLLGIGSIAVSGYIWNDLCDIKTDAKNYSTRPIPSGEIVPIVALLLAIGYAATAWYCALLLSFSHTGMMLVMSIVLVLYSPVIKRLPLIGNLTVAGLFTAAFGWGLLTVRGNWSEVSWITAYLFTFSLTREMIETLADKDGDRAAGYHTLPVVAPEWITYGVILITYMITIVLSLQRWDSLGKINMISSLVAASGLMIILVVASLNQNPPRLRLLSKFMNLCLLIGLVGLITSAI